MDRELERLRTTTDPVEYNRLHDHIVATADPWQLHNALERMRKADDAAKAPERARIAEREAAYEHFHYDHDA